MNLEQLKRVPVDLIPGCDVESDREGDTVRRVVVRSQGRVILVMHAPSYEGLRLLVPAKPKMVDRHAVGGSVKGVPVFELFEHEHEAKRRVEELRSLGSSGDVVVDYEKVAVPEEEEQCDVPF
jgi:hypothetical protein